MAIFFSKQEIKEHFVYYALIKRGIFDGWTIFSEETMGNRTAELQQRLFQCVLFD